jgi:hypothetical protein
MFKKILIIISLSLLTSNVYSAGIKLKHLKSRNNILYCSLRAYVNDTIDMAWILNQGINLKANYSISLYQRNKRWGPDTLLTNVTVYYRSQKDVINNGYEVESIIAGHKKEYWISSQESLFKFLMNTPYTPVISLNDLSSDQEYYLQFQLSITSLELYPPLSLIYQLLGRWSYRSPKINSRIFSFDSILED